MSCLWNLYHTLCLPSAAETKGSLKKVEKKFLVIHLIVPGFIWRKVLVARFLVVGDESRYSCDALCRKL